MKEISALLALIAAGSALGGMARFFVSGLVARAIGETFPWGTLVVNVTGAFSIGILAYLAENHHLADLPQAWPLAVTGFLGSYTTISSFSLQTLALARDGEWRQATVNVVLSLVICLAAVALGMVAGHAAIAAGIT